MEQLFRTLACSQGDNVSVLIVLNETSRTCVGFCFCWLDGRVILFRVKARAVSKLGLGLSVGLELQRGLLSIHLFLKLQSLPLQIKSQCTRVQFSDSSQLRLVSHLLLIFYSNVRILNRVVKMH